MKGFHIFGKELLRRGTRHRDLVHIVQQALNKGRAIDALFIGTTIFVGRVHPFIDKSIQRHIGDAIRRGFQISGVFQFQFLFGAQVAVLIGRRRTFHNDRLVALSAFARAAAAGQYSNKQQNTN